MSILLSFNFSERNMSILSRHRFPYSMKSIALTLVSKELPTEFFTIRVSVRLSDRSKVTQNKINFVKIAPSGV